MKISKIISFIVILIFLTISFVQSIWAQQGRATADGFVGVPWGSTREQTKSILQKKGYRLITNKVAFYHDADLYSGSFAGEASDLYFHYRGEDYFYMGSAYLVGYKGQGTDIAKVGYYNVIKVMKAKYGNCDREYSTVRGEVFGCSWGNLSTSKPPHGIVSIDVQAGAIGDPSGRASTGVHIQYVYKKFERGDI